MCANRLIEMLDNDLITRYVCSDNEVCVLIEMLDNDLDNDACVLIECICVYVCYRYAWSCVFVHMWIRMYVFFTRPIKTRDTNSENYFSAFTAARCTRVYVYRVRVYVYRAGVYVYHSLRLAEVLPWINQPCASVCVHAFIYIPTIFHVCKPWNGK